MVLDRMEAGNRRNESAPRLEVCGGRGLVVIGEVDAVRNNLDAIAGKSVLVLQRVGAEVAHGIDPIRESRQQQAVAKTSLARDVIRIVPAVLGQDQFESTARSKLRKRRVEEGRVLVRVYDVNLPAADLVGQSARNAEIKARLPTEHHDVDALALELSA
jgi:hypothetical protein